jgi:integrase
MIKELNFTQASIANIPSPLERIEYKDAKQGSFQLRVSPSGDKVFYIYRRVRGAGSGVAAARIKIGSFDSLSLADARAEFKRLDSLCEQGIDPRESAKEKQAESVLLSQAYKEYIASRKEVKHTLRNYDSLYRTYLEKYSNKQLASINRKLVEKLYLDIESDSQAEGTKRLLRAIFNFAKNEYLKADGTSYFPDNPTGIIKHKRLTRHVGRKTTYVRGSNFNQFKQALLEVREAGTITAKSICDAMEFALYTGLRKEEVIGLKWSDVYDEYMVFTNTKAGRPLELPITKQITEIINRERFIKREYVFAAENVYGKIKEPKKVVAKVKDKCGLDCGWHDLRRSFSTIAVTNGISKYVLKRLCNHSLSNDVTEGYTILTPEELRGPCETIHGDIYVKLRKLRGA